MMNKNEIMTNLVDQREQFLDVIEGLTEEELSSLEVAGQWSIKDILAHISHWEAELVKLLWQVSQGQRPTSMQFMIEGNLDEVNQTWYEESASREIARVLDDFQAVRSQTMLRVESFSDRDLTNPKRYPALGGKPLWEYIENDSFGHEAEHLVDIQRWLEQRKPS